MSWILPRRLQPVVLDDPAADLGLAGAGAAGEEGRAVEDDADTAAALGLGPHLGDQVQEEQQAAVGDPGQALLGRILSEDLGLGGLQDAVQQGRMTRPYSDCLKLPRSRSATDQIRAEVVVPMRYSLVFG